MNWIRQTIRSFHSTWKVNKKEVAILFLPKAKENKFCAVCQTYALLNPERDSSIDFFLIPSGTSKEEIFRRVRGKKRLIIFAHYQAEASNLFFYDQGENVLSWDRILDPARTALYGHICFGAHFLTKRQMEDWVSYSDKIQILFGVPEYEERMKLFLFKIVKTMAEGATVEEISDKIRKHYLEEIKFVSANRATPGFKTLLIHLYDAYQCISDYPSPNLGLVG